MRRSGRNLIEMADMERKRLRETPMDKATPRPWHIEEAGRDGRFMHDKQRMIFGAATHVATVPRDNKQDDANAALIVAAVNSFEAHRQLAEAARSLLEVLDDEAYGDDGRKIRIALAAVDKVEKP